MKVESVRNQELYQQEKIEKISALEEIGRYNFYFLYAKNKAIYFIFNLCYLFF
jgi:hypothetical protein